MAATQEPAPQFQVYSPRKTNQSVIGASAASATVANVSPWVGSVVVASVSVSVSALLAMEGGEGGVNPGSCGASHGSRHRQSQNAESEYQRRTSVRYPLTKPRGWFLCLR